MFEDNVLQILCMLLFNYYLLLWVNKLSALDLTCAEQTFIKISLQKVSVLRQCF